MAQQPLELAIDELYATGWAALDTTGCQHHSDGRTYPGPVRAQKEFAGLGHELRIVYVQLFDCYRAEWVDGTGQATGAVFGSTEVEAAIYALAILRKLLQVGAIP